MSCEENRDEDGTPVSVSDGTAPPPSSTSTIGAEEQALQGANEGTPPAEAAATLQTTTSGEAGMPAGAPESFAERPAADEEPATFEAMGVSAAVMQALEEMGYTAPMEVQRKTYRPIASGKDLIVQSRTGSGKTAAFGIPLVDKVVVEEQKAVQTLVLCPTRELALQVATELGRLGSYKGMSVVPVYGGAPMGRQVEGLRAGAQIVVGTPGRVLDHLKRETLDPTRIRCLVLDECDEMLSMGFLEDIEAIIGRLPAERQTLLFSATIPEEVERIAQRHMRNPERFFLSKDFVGVHEIRHAFYMVSGLGRPSDLVRVLEYENPESGIIFCNTRDDTAMLAAYLQRHGYDALALSGDLSQNERERVMARMKAGKLRFLVATDVAARGIDIEGLPCVVNYTFPESPEIYVHRTGRTGRAGRPGVALSLVSPHEIGNLYYLKLTYKIRPEERSLPSDQELRTRREGERYERLRKMCVEDPGEEWLSLARRVWHAADGERLVASVLRNFLEAGERAEAEKSRAPTQRETGTRPQGRHGTDRAEGMPNRATHDLPQARRQKPERGSRDESRSRDRMREREPQREGRHHQEHRGRSDESKRTDRETRHRPSLPEEPRREEPPASAGLGSTPPVTVPPGMEFWEAWIEQRSQAARGWQQAESSDDAAGEAEPGGYEPGTDEGALPKDASRLYLNLGRRDGVRPDDVARLLAERAGVDAPLKIQVRNTHTYITLRDEEVPRVLNALNGGAWGDRSIVCEPARGR